MSNLKGGENNCCLFPDLWICPLHWVQSTGSGNWVYQVHSSVWYQANGAEDNGKYKAWGAVMCTAIVYFTGRLWGFQCQVWRKQKLCWTSNNLKGIKYVLFCVRLWQIYLKKKKKVAKFLCSLPKQKLQHETKLQALPATQFPQSRWTIVGLKRAWHDFSNGSWSNQIKLLRQTSPYDPPTCVSHITWKIMSNTI